MVQREIFSPCWQNAVVDGKRGSDYANGGFMLKNNP